MSIADALDRAVVDAIAGHEGDLEIRLISSVQDGWFHMTKSSVASIEQLARYELAGEIGLVVTLRTRRHTGLAGILGIAQLRDGSRAVWWHADEMVATRSDIEEVPLPLEVAIGIACSSRSMSFDETSSKRAFIGFAAALSLRHHDEFAQPEFLDQILETLNLDYLGWSDIFSMFSGLDPHLGTLDDDYIISVALEAVREGLVTGSVPQALRPWLNRAVESARQPSVS